MNIRYVTDFGAVPFSEDPQTEMLQRAIDHCFKIGGGEVRVPAGDFLTGGLRLRSNVRLYLEQGAHLIGSREPKDYFAVLSDKLEPLAPNDLTDVLWKPVDVRKNFDHMNRAGSSWNNALIRAIDADNIAIIGENGSYIDGRDCFDISGEEHYRGPHAVNFFRCSNIIFKGYEIKNSANWAHALFDCTNIQMENVTVTAGHDGIHLTSCRNIDIRRCDFYTGDDCIAGIDNLNMSVSDCVLNTACSAFRFGGTNAVIEKCRIFGPAKYLFRGSLSDEEKRNGGQPVGGRRNMLSAFTYYADFSRNISRPAGHILMTDCDISNADRFLHYNYSGNEPWQRNKPLEEITFKRIKARGIKNPLTAYGSSDIPIRLALEDCEISFSENRAPEAFMHLCNYDKVLLKNTTVKNVNGGELIKSWSEGGEIVADNFDTYGFDGEFLKITDEPFVCGAI